MIVLQLLCFDPILPHHDPPLQARITAAAVTGKHFNAIQRGHDAALHPAGIEGLIAFERSINVHQHGFQPGQRKARKAVSQHVIAEGTVRANPSLQSRLSDFCFHLLKAGQAENETMKGGQEYGHGPDLGNAAGIGESAGRVRKSKTLLR